MKKPSVYLLEVFSLKNVYFSKQKNRTRGGAVVRFSDVFNEYLYPRDLGR
ncbi:MAG: hypothetical protein UX57_C0017G0014 [Candidatus Uhrbacteria bacterium GW2011_GWE2_46_68]|uniref:Uncharacterized protein n=2 Tax=Candidatus Uhriibacteriota TaxID=1752732 RepID=A0A0G1Q6H0_9BACT|nr:MAG: hypothetical protein UX45_C0018G0014 [Candidatus Uhrbacteria bacterium GW2011_GWF2_46_218]KKU40422.1 MAG: hypothetical protein UX57_C0017G0014 [Candidatus Uhrbacteria bacterium GW2011_GWE2_46_68]